MRGTRVVFGSIAAVALAISLAACVPESAPVTSTLPPPTTTPTQGPIDPTLDPDSARESKPYFDVTNLDLIAAKPAAQGRDFIDNLVTAGFVKADMELTPDTTPAGKVADSIQFSVRFGESCLIGQYGQTTGYVSLVADVTATSTCLIGATRPIDW